MPRSLATNDLRRLGCALFAALQVCSVFAANPNGIGSNSPRLARGTRANLGLGARRYYNPTGVVWQADWSIGVDATPLGLAEYGIIFPKVAACRRNLGLRATIPMGLKNIQFVGSNLLVEDVMTDLPCENRAACLAKSTLGRLYGNRSFACQSPCSPPGCEQCHIA